MTDSQSSKERLPWLTTDVVLGVLRGYRLQNQTYVDNPDSHVLLVDALTPEHCSTVELGQSELELLADHIASEIVEKSPFETADGPGEEDGPWAEGWAERSGQLSPLAALEYIQHARLTWAMVCRCTCLDCDKFYEFIRDVGDAAIDAARASEKASESNCAVVVYKDGTHLHLRDIDEALARRSDPDWLVTIPYMMARLPEKTNSYSCADERLSRIAAEAESLAVTLEARDREIERLRKLLSVNDTTAAYKCTECGAFHLRVIESAADRPAAENSTPDVTVCDCDRSSEYKCRNSTNFDICHCICHGANQPLPQTSEPCVCGAKVPCTQWSCDCGVINHHIPNCGNCGAPRSAFPRGGSQT